MKPIQYPDSDQALAAAVADGSRELRTSIAVHRPWQPDPSQLQAHYLIDSPTPGRTIVELNGLRIPLDCPLQLEPIAVTKPWGEEIWHSGIEARGESHIAVQGGSLPLLDYLSLAPGALCGQQPVILLKLLNSQAQSITGELYFEIHEEKREVYVVTAVDRGFYPDGVGQIRFGMNQDLRAQYPDDATFRQAFLAAVQHYEATAQSHTATANASRAAMLSFVASEALRQGDALVVEPGVPHSLQPGLRVLEFQTPVFERRIIFASQPVVTQAGWNSASAIADMSLDTPPGPRAADDPDPIIAQFPEFSVRRLRLNGSASQPLPAGAPYALCISLAGEVRIDSAHSSLTLREGAAAFIPGSARHVNCCADHAAQLLVAVPGS